ncbi:MAG: 3-dehydroquinate synthase [bacterium]|nr:3-dehydroquinate synthase [bacterium]
MKNLTLKTPRGNYTVYVGNVLFLSDVIKKELFSNRKVFVVFDENVPTEFVYNIKNALKRANSDVFLHNFSSGEENKNLESVLKIASKAFEVGITRKDVFFAVGGGVVSDVVGFLSSVYMRGVGFYCVPTTLLSAVDACVGGKNGVDLPEGKNLIGTFYNPEAVFCDTAAFASLNERDIKNALGECVKYALIDGGKLWKYFIDISLNPPENNDYRHIISDKQLTEKLIFACLSVKKRFVEKDQFDKGERAVLNLGHTVGHAIEAMSDYKLSHGECVAKGIVQELRASVNMGFTDKSVLTDVISIFETLGISTDNPFLAEDEIEYIYVDKKRAGDSINIPVIISPGEYEIKNIGISEYKEFLCRL